MTVNETEIEVTLAGPYSWPGFESENDLPPIPEKPGVYLWTFEYQNGYLIYVAGITRRTIPLRLKQHTLKYMNGEYHVLDVDAAKQGIRKLVWEGWQYAKAHRDEFKEKQSVIIDAVNSMLAAYRIFGARWGQTSKLDKFQFLLSSLL